MSLSGVPKQEKQIETFFSSFATSISCSNTKIFHDSHVINFTTSTGEVFNIKFKNEISKIFPILDGIIIKLQQSTNNLSFFYKKISSEQNNYRNFILACNPLSSVYPLISGLENVDVIATSKKFPFVIYQNGSVQSLGMIMCKKNNNIKNFEQNVLKMLNPQFDQFYLGNENPSLFPSDCVFNVVHVCDFANTKFDEGSKIKIYMCYSDKNCVYVANRNSQTNSLMIFKVSFNQPSAKISSVTFDNCVAFKLCDSFLNRNSSLEYDFETDFGPRVKTPIEEYFSECNEKGVINFKTLCYIDKESNAWFIEGGKVLFKVNFVVGFDIKNFNIKKGTQFQFMNGELYAQINKDAYKINDSNALVLLKYFKVEYGEEIYYSLLKALYMHIITYVDDTEKDFISDVNHFSYLCFILFNIFTSSSQDTSTKYRKIFCDNERENDYDSLIYEPTFVENQIISTISMESSSVKDALISIIDFSKGMYDNMKSFNSYETLYTTDVLLNFILNLLILVNDNDIIYSYLEYFSCYHHIDVESLDIKVLYPSKFVEIAKESKFSFNHIDNISKIRKEIEESSSKPDNAAKEETDAIIINTNEEKEDEEFKIFSRIKEAKELEQNSAKNFLTKILSSNYTFDQIKVMHWRNSLLFLHKISQAKNAPYLYLNSNSSSLLTSQILTLINRPDLSRNITTKAASNASMENLTSMLYKNETSDYDSEYYLTQIKFQNDNRIREANRILSPTRILKINSSSLNSIVDLTQLETEKFILSYKNLIRQYTSCIGNGAINLNTIKTFPKEILIIKQLNTQCLLTTDESTYNLDTNRELLKDKDFTQWAEFHNGVAQSIKLSTENFNNKSYIRNWILFNKPQTPNFEHGGFLLGMGLLKQLDSLYATDVYQYMKSAHDGVTIGILLGRSASKLGSMEETLSRTLCLHISFLIPSTLEINIPMNIQCSAVMGIGMIYLGSGNRLMIEMLLNQIGKISNNSDKSIDMKHLDSYNLCLGFAIGLINLGIGKDNSSTNYDLNYDDKLFALIDGYSDISSDQTNSPSNAVNIKQTAPSAYSCLALSYLMTKNTKIASRIKIPNNLYKLETFRPFHLYLAILTKNLILWDSEIKPTEAWIYSNIPDFIRFLYENPLSVISDDISYTFKINLIEFSQITTSYYYSLCAGITSLAFFYCGTNNKTITNIILKIITQKLFKVRVLTDIIIKENTKYNDTNKSAINKTTLDICFCICAYAVSIIMAGSGDLDTFKILRILRKKVDSVDYKNFVAGYTQCIDHAIGILFLGGGGLTFNSSSTSLSSIAFLFISTFPVFATTLNDNEKYLQALRHLYVLSCENKIFETRDIKTDKIVHANLTMVTDDGVSHDVVTPVNVENISRVKKIYMRDFFGYYDMEIDNDDLKRNSMNLNTNNMQARVAFIKQKNIFSNEVVLAATMIDKTDQSIMNCIRYLRQGIKNMSEKITTITNCVIDGIVDVAAECTEQTKVELKNVYSKSALVFLVYFINKDNIDVMYVVNDYLNKMFRAVKEGRFGEFKDFDVVDFFNNFGEDCDDGNDGIGLCFRICVEEIKEFLMNFIRQKFEQRLQKFQKSIKDNSISREQVDWGVIQTAYCGGLSLKNLVDICHGKNECIDEGNYDFVKFLKGIEAK